MATAETAKDGDPVAILLVAIKMFDDRIRSMAWYNKEDYLGVDRAYKETFLPAVRQLQSLS